MRLSGFPVTVLLGLQLLVLNVQGIPRYCRQSIRAEDSARNSYQETKTSVVIPRCRINSLTWKEPRFNHIMVFFKRRLSFQLCLRTAAPGVTFYRLKGTSRQLIARSNTSGELGCFESHCKHLSFRMEPEGKLSLQNLQFTYTFRIMKKIAKCTEVCQKSCLCNSQYIFIGKLQHLARSSTGLYRLYFKIAQFIKYDNNFTKRFHPYLQQCAIHNATTSLLNTMTMDNRISPFSPSILVPREGIIRVYSKSTLERKDKHLVAGSLQLFLPKTRGIVLCCVDQDENYATNYLADLIFRQHCC